MTETKCRQRDCLCFHVKGERVGSSANEVFCVAGIADPRREKCERYTPPSWKPWAQTSQRSRK